VRLVADADLLLAAVLGGRAKAILQHHAIEEVFTTVHTLAEVQEYALILAKTKRLSVDTLLLAVASLPVTLVEQSIYAAALPQARTSIGKRDPDDVEILALTMHMGLPLWTNDKDFDGTGVKRYTTADLLEELQLRL
jgi:predicted nucleic acid-binding protein